MIRVESRTDLCQVQPLRGVVVRIIHVPIEVLVRVGRLAGGVAGIWVKLGRLAVTLVQRHLFSAVTLAIRQGLVVHISLVGIELPTGIEAQRRIRSATVNRTNCTNRNRTGTWRNLGLFPGRGGLVLVQCGVLVEIQEIR